MSNKQDIYSADSGKNCGIIYDKGEIKEAKAWLEAGLLEILMEDAAPDWCALETQVLKARGYAVAIDVLSEKVV